MIFDFEKIAKQLYDFVKIDDKDLSVGNTLTNFITPKLMLLMHWNTKGAEYHCYVDGELVSNVADISARGITLFTKNCKYYQLTLEEKVHRVTFILPLGEYNGYCMYTQYIIPTINDEPVITNETEHQLGFYSNGFYKLNISDVEKQFLNRVDGIILRWGKTGGVIINE